MSDCSTPGYHHQAVTRRGLLVLGAVALTVAAALAWSSVRTDRAFRRLLAEGERAAAERQVAVAVEAYSGALALRPDSMVAHLRRGDMYRRQGAYELALRDLREASALDPSAPQPADLLGDVNLAMGRLDGAVQAYRRALALDDRAPRVQYKLALGLYRANRNADAVRALERALALDDTLAEAHYLLGVCLREQRRPQEGLRELRRAVALNPALVPAREALADVFRVGGRRREQIEQLEAIAALEPDEPRRLISIADAYARSGRPDTALATIERLSDPLPEEPDVRTEVARVWLAAAESGHNAALVARAERLLSPMTAQASASGDALALLGRIQRLRGNLVGAEETLQRAVARLPVAPQTFLDLADTAERLRHLTIARGAVVDYAALASDADDRQRAFVRVATLSLALGDPATAEQWAARATDNANRDVSALVALATAQQQLGRTADARQSVARGLALEPKHPALIGLQRRLRSRG